MIRALAIPPSQNIVSGVQAASGTTKFNYINGDFNSVVFKLNISATSAPTSLDVYVQTTPDGGTTWLDVLHFAQLAATTATPHWATAKVDQTSAVHGAIGDASIAASSTGVPIMSQQARLKYTIVGTSFTFTVDAFYVHQEKTI